MSKRESLSVHAVTPKDLYRLARDNGFEVLPKRGKGSHMMMRHPDGRTVVLPDPDRGAKKFVGRNVVRKNLKVIQGVG